MSDINKKNKIEKFTKIDNNGILPGKTGDLVNYKQIENKRDQLTAGMLTQTQSALALKINEIIDAFSTLKGYLPEETLKKIANILVGENGFDLLEQLLNKFGVGKIDANEIATNDFVKSEDAKLKDVIDKETVNNFIKKDLANLSDPEKTNIAQALFSLKPEQFEELRNFPDTLNKVNSILKPGNVTAFLDQIENGNAPYDTHQEVSDKITAAISAVNGTLTVDPNNDKHLVFSGDDRGKQIILTDAAGTGPLSIDDPNALITKHYLDEGLNEKIGIKDGLVELVDDLRFFPEGDGSTGKVKYFNAESQHYINDYDTSIGTVGSTTNVSVSDDAFSIYQRLTSIGNEFTGTFYNINDFVEYEFNSNYSSNLYTVKFVAKAKWSWFNFYRDTSDNIAITTKNVEIWIDKHDGNGLVKQPDDATVNVGVDVMFYGNDKIAALTKFRAYIDGGVGQGAGTTEKGETFWPIIILSMKVHAEYAVRRMIITEERDFSLLKQTKQDKLTQDQITKINNIPANMTPTTLDDYLLKNDYVFVKPNDATIKGNYLAIKNGPGLLLQDEAGVGANTAYAPNSVVPKHWIDAELNKIKTHSISGQIQDKFEFNSDKLTMNDDSDNPGDAAIGEGYKGTSRYSHGSTGLVVFGGNHGWQAGKPRGSVELGYQSSSVKVGEGSINLELGGSTVTTEIGFGDGTAIKNTEQNGVAEDAKIYKKDGTAGISLDKLATIDTDTQNTITTSIKTATVASDWELVTDVPTMKFDTSPGTGGGTTTADGIPWLEDNYADLSDFGTNAKDYEVVKFDENEDGSPNSQGFLFYVKTPGGLKRFITWEETKSYIDALEVKVNKNAADITQLASEIQVIENVWTGSENAHGVDLATLTGDKGAFDLSTGAKLFATFKIDGITPEVTQEVEIIQGKHVVHLTSVDRTVDVSFQVQTAPIADGKHLLAISDFESHGTTAKTETDIKLVELLQNPKVTAVIDAYTKAEADALFEPRTYDYSGGTAALTYNVTDGKRHQLITMPAGADKTPIGVINKIKVVVTATEPTQIPQDTDQVDYGTDLLWINKAKTDIMSWSEIKNEVAANKIMVIKKISDGNWELVRWEDTTSAKRVGLLPGLQGDVPWLTDKYANVTDFFNKAADYEMVKYNSLPNGDPINIIIYAKTPTGIREFRCWEEVNKFVNGETNRLQKQIDINFQDIMENSKGITALEQSIGNKIQITSRVNGSDTISDTTKVLVKQPDGHVYLANPVVSEPDYIHLFNKVQDNEGKCDRNTLDIKHIKQMMADLNKKFAPLVYDFTAKAEMLTHATAMGKEYARITEPANVEDAPIGAIIKVVPRIGVYAPASTDEMSFGTHMLFLNEKNNHVMTWADAQPHVENAETLVLKKTNKFIYELVRWEKEANAFRDINYGVASAGKYLKVDDHGWIVPVDAPILFKK